MCVISKLPVPAALRVQVGGTTATAVVPPGGHVTPLLGDVADDDAVGVVDAVDGTAAGAATAVALSAARGGGGSVVVVGGDVPHLACVTLARLADGDGLQRQLQWLAAGSAPGLATCAVALTPLVYYHNDLFAPCTVAAGSSTDAVRCAVGATVAVPLPVAAVSVAAGDGGLMLALSVTLVDVEGRGQAAAHLRLPLAPTARVCGAAWHVAAAAAPGCWPLVVSVRLEAGEWHVRASHAVQVLVPRQDGLALESTPPPLAAPAPVAELYAPPCHRAAYAAGACGAEFRTAMSVRDDDSSSGGWCGASTPPFCVAYTGEQAEPFAGVGTSVLAEVLTSPDALAADWADLAALAHLPRLLVGHHARVPLLTTPPAGAAGSATLHDTLRVAARRDEHGILIVQVQRDIDAPVRLLYNAGGDGADASGLMVGLGCTHRLPRSMTRILVRHTRPPPRRLLAAYLRAIEAGLRSGGGVSGGAGGGEATPAELWCVATKMAFASGSEGDDDTDGSSGEDDDAAARWRRAEHHPLLYAELADNTAAEVPLRVHVRGDSGGGSGVGVDWLFWMAGVGPACGWLVPAWPLYWDVPGAAAAASSSSSGGGGGGGGGSARPAEAGTHPYTAPLSLQPGRLLEGRETPHFAPATLELEAAGSDDSGGGGSGGDGTRRAGHVSILRRVTALPLAYAAEAGAAWMHAAVAYRSGACVLQLAPGAEAPTAHGNAPPPPRSLQLEADEVAVSWYAPAAGVEVTPPALVALEGGGDSAPAPWWEAAPDGLPAAVLTSALPGAAHGVAPEVGRLVLRRVVARVGLDATGTATRTLAVGEVAVLDTTPSTGGSGGGGGGGGGGGSGGGGGGSGGGSGDVAGGDRGGASEDARPLLACVGSRGASAASVTWTAAAGGGGRRNWRGPTTLTVRVPSQLYVNVSDAVAAAVVAAVRQWRPAAVAVLSLVVPGRAPSPGTPPRLPRCVLPALVAVDQVDIGAITASVTAAVSGPALPLQVRLQAATLRLPAVGAVHLHAPAARLRREVVAFVLADQLMTLPALLGSLDIFGNPSGFLRDARTGIARLFELERGAGLGAPLALVGGALEGTGHLVLRVAEGALRSLSAFSFAVAHNVDRLAAPGVPPDTRSRSVGASSSASGPAALPDGPAPLGLPTSSELAVCAAVRRWDTVGGPAACGALTAPPRDLFLPLQLAALARFLPRSRTAVGGAGGGGDGVEVTGGDGGDSDGDGDGRRGRSSHMQAAFTSLGRGLALAARTVALAPGAALRQRNAGVLLTAVADAVLAPLAGAMGFVGHATTGVLAALDTREGLRVAAAPPQLLVSLAVPSAMLARAASFVVAAAAGSGAGAGANASRRLVWYAPAVVSVSAHAAAAMLSMWAGACGAPAWVAVVAVAPADGGGGGAAQHLLLLLDAPCAGVFLVAWAHHLRATVSGGSGGDAGGRLGGSGGGAGLLGGTPLGASGAPTDAASPLLLSCTAPPLWVAPVVAAGDDSDAHRTSGPDANPFVARTGRPGAPPAPSDPAAVHLILPPWASRALRAFLPSS